MIDLDALDLARADPQGMLATVERAPHQWADALDIATAGPSVSVDRDITAVVVAGMGGSGIAGDVAAAVAQRQGAVPVLTAKGYELPAFTSGTTLVVVVSYSGHTEEALSCLDAATEAGAVVAAIASGGAVAERVAAAGGPVVTIPGGGKPRAALPYLATAVLVLLDRAQLVRDVTGELADVGPHLARLVEEWGHDAATEVNPAKQLAVELEPLVPVFWGARGWPAVAALRARGQVNENAKRPAFCNEMPELDHNEVLSWSGVGDGGRGFAIVELRSDEDEHAQITRRFDATREVIEQHVGLHRTLRFAGRSALARFAAAVLFVDLVSVYLALLGGVDPSEDSLLDRLKRRLAEPA